MPLVTRNTVFVLGVLSGAALLSAAAFVWSGVYNVGADDPHTRPVHALMQSVRERSIQARASKLQVPDLKDPARIIQGSGNYNAMCMGCHLAPGMQGTELSRGLYPAPPNLTQGTVHAAEAFWVIKHGIKASGMPAWGTSMQDEYIWNMVAFLQELPRMDAARYQSLVDSSGGHDHGGGETEPHDHAEGVAEDHHAAEAGNPAGAAASNMVEHRHADGTVESHPAPPTQRKPGKSADGHDHQH